MRWGWGDLDSTFTLMDEFRRRMDRLFDDFEDGRGLPLLDVTRAAWPRTWLADTGSALVLRAEVPGLSDKDIQLSVNQDVLSLSGERKTPAPEGYTTHRQERPAARFSRNVALPARVDLERCTAMVKDGVLTVTLPKASESQPRQISVKTI
jgi:HSP20 family protein